MTKHALTALTLALFVSACTGGVHLFPVDPETGQPVLQLCEYAHDAMAPPDAVDYGKADCRGFLYGEGRASELSCPGALPSGFFREARKDGVFFVRVGTATTSPIYDLNKERIIFCKED